MIVVIVFILLIVCALIIAAVRVLRGFSIGRCTPDWPDHCRWKTTTAKDLLAMRLITRSRNGGELWRGGVDRIELTSFRFERFPGRERIDVEQLQVLHGVPANSMSHRC